MIKLPALYMNAINEHRLELNHVKTVVSFVHNKQQLE